VRIGKLINDRGLELDDLKTSLEYRMRELKNLLEAIDSMGTTLEVSNMM
jgi:hypothetical protein